MDAQAKVIIVWVAYALGIVVMGTPFAAIIMAYFCRNTNEHHGLAGHNAAQIRSFWWGFLGWMIALAIMLAGLAIGLTLEDGMGNGVIPGVLLMAIGLLIGVIVQITFTVYAVIGIVRASGRQNWPGAATMQNASAVFG